jgi:FtsH-binding integral membrane protein
MACIYIIFDTQIIVERAERGDKDIPRDTLHLFIDMVQLFIKILQILIKLNEDNKKSEKRRS